MEVKVCEAGEIEYKGFELTRIDSDEGTIATVRFSEEMPDGDYSFTVMVSDDSGNTASESREFTLSRLNSVFTLMAGSVNDEGYLKKDAAVVMEESSLVPVYNSNVNVFCNGKLTELSGDEYNFALKKHDDSYIYRYEIFPEAFEADGYYMVTVTDTDASGKMNTATFEFKNDNTPPTVIVSGMEDGVIYEKGHEYLLTVRDNIAVKKFVISINGEETVYIKEEGLYVNNDDGEDILDASQESIKFKIPEADDSFTMIFRAADEAGNEYVSEEYHVNSKKTADFTWIAPVIAIAAAVTILILRQKNKKK